MKLTLEQFAEYARKFRQRELSALRAENLLMRRALGVDSTPLPAVVAPVVIFKNIKVVDTVRAVLNGHALDTQEIRSAVRIKFPHVPFTRRKINSLITHLRNRGEATRIGEPGKYRYLKTAASVLLGIALITGCRTSQQAFAPPRPPNMPSAATTPDVRAPLSPRATLTWHALPDMESYRVDYGLTADNMNESIATSTNTCTIVRDAGQYAYQIRGVYHGTYTPPIRSGVFEIK